jgi:hypothetical protein
MMSDISLFFRRGWENLWKEKILWLFSSLVLIDPLVRFVIPIRSNNNPLLSLLNFVISLIFLALMLVSYTGTTYVAYSITVGNPINIQETFQVGRKFFWRVIASSCSYFLFFIIFFVLCLSPVFIFYFKRPPQFSDFSRYYFYISIFLSVFTASWHFLLAEVVVKDSRIGKSLENAWDLFIENFAVLAVIGITLSIMTQVVNVAVTTVTILIHYDFDFSALTQFNLIVPQLSFMDSKLYLLGATTLSVVWRTYGTSVFMVAYLKYSSLKVDEHITP